MTAGMKRILIPLPYADLTTWPFPDVSVLSADILTQYQSRRQAVEMYAAGEPYSKITQVTGKSDDETRRLIKRCLTLGDNGKIVGLYALIPGARLKDYERKAVVKHAKGSGSSGCAGALEQVFKRYPDIRQLVHDAYLKGGIGQDIREARTPLYSIHKSFKKALRERGFTDFDWPFNTSALEMVEAMLRIQLPRMPIYVHDTHNQQLPSVRAFFKHFLYTVGHPEKRGETYDLRERLVNCMIDDARISGSNIVLLFIDEAHAMAVQDFDFLKDVYNDLNRESVQLITVLMGQEPDLSNIIFKLKTLGRLDLIGRFAMRIQPFRAFDSIRDLTQILKQIDEAAFPESSNLTWTAFFFPEAYKSGFRLENEAPRFMEAISAASPKSSGKNFAFPARQTFLAIRTLMIDCAKFDKVNMMLPDVAWIEAVEYAKLQDSMQLMKVGDEGNELEVET